jgi:hypothetical protein
MMAEKTMPFVSLTLIQTVKSRPTSCRKREGTITVLRGKETLLKIVAKKGVGVRVNESFTEIKVSLSAYSFITVACTGVSHCGLVFIALGSCESYLF